MNDCWTISAGALRFSRISPTFSAQRVSSLNARCLAYCAVPDAALGLYVYLTKDFERPKKSVSFLTLRPSRLLSCSSSSCCSCCCAPAAAAGPAPSPSSSSDSSSSLSQCRFLSWKVLQCRSHRPQPPAPRHSTACLHSAPAAPCCPGHRQASSGRAKARRRWIDGCREFATV